MIRRIFGILFALSLLAGCSVSQSPLTCDIGQGGGSGGWYAKYTLKPSQPTGQCSQVPGEGLGVRKYFPDGQKPMVVIRTDILGNMANSLPVDPTAADSEGSLIQDHPDSNNLCIIPTMTKAEVIGAGYDGAYEWSDVKFVVAANVPGTQMSATLMRTEGGCTAEYKVVAMQPNVDCFQIDSDGNTVLDSMGNQIPDVSRCSPQSNVNPDFAVTCDPDLLKCVLASDPPSLLNRGQ
ncbi:MAG TPA: hypothetical protein VKB87_17435 [Myxococcaceae bacterium]|nr:hypothetical protein [Myxococcaceae bacterium]